MAGMGISDSDDKREEIEFAATVLHGMNWSDDKLFYTHRWRDETSMFDDHPTVRWNGGSDTYTREFKARVPIAFRDCDELVEKFVTMMQDDYPDAEGFWVD